MQGRDWLCLWIGLAFLILSFSGCQATPTQPLASSLATPTPTLTSRMSPTVMPTSTPIATLTSTPTVVPTSTPTVSPTLMSTETTAPSATPLRPTETSVPIETPSVTATTLKATPTTIPGTVKAAPTATPRPETPTSTPTSAYRFSPILPAQPDPSHACPSCPKAPAYIVGHVTDADGRPLAGVRLVCYNEWHRYPVVASKGGGEYDFPIIQADTTWYVVVLDQNDQPISPEAPVTVDLLKSCRYMLDWRRMD